MSKIANVGLLRVAVAVLLSMATTYVAWGQGAITTGTVAGDVTDVSGALLPGAKATVQNQATGLSRTAVTDGSGHFVVSQLPAGNYQVSVTATGFKEAVVHGVQLNVDSTASLKIKLEVGGAAEKVNVSVEAAEFAVDTEKSDVSGVIQAVQVQQLPLNQRSFTALITQEPGVVVMTNALPPSPSVDRLQAGSFISVDGMNGSNVAYLQDGVAINNAGQSAPGTFAARDLPGLEGIEEFKVATHNYSAAYPGGGAVVSFATRGGTNTLHGSLYEFLRNNKVDARDYFNNTGTQNPYKRSQFGGTLGGPIRKDKIFFFGNYEGLRQRLSTTNIGFVPSLAARNGGLDGTSGFPVYGPILQTDGSYIQGPVAIPAGVKSLLNLYPLPNGQDFGGSGVAQLSFQNQQPIRQDYGVLRTDFNLSSRDGFTVRYTITDANATSAYGLSTFAYARDSRLQNLQLKWTRTFGTAAVNTLAFGFMRSKNFAEVAPTVPVSPEQYTADPANKIIGPVMVGSFTAGFGNTGGLSTLGNDSSAPFHLIKNYFPVNDDFTMTLGSHTIKLGGLVQRMQNNVIEPQYIGGGWTFLNVNDLLAGNPMDVMVRRQGSPPEMYYRSTLFGWYVEDAWRARPTFTITAGLRHEFQVPILSEIHNNIGNWPGALTNDTTFKTGSSWINNYSLKQFQPRLGFAYDPFNNGKTVIRAGVGIFNTSPPVDLLLAPLYFETPYPNTGFLPGNPLAPSVLPPLPFPNCVSCTAASPTMPVIYIPWTGPMKSPTTYQWNLAVERDVGHNFNVAVTYAGSESRHLHHQYMGNHNLPCGTENGMPIFPPACASVGTAESAFSSATPPALVVVNWGFDQNANYNGMTVSLKRRYVGGLSLNASYTWAKAMSQADADNTTLAGNNGESAYPGNWGYDYSESNYSIKHRFTFNSIFDLPFGRQRRFGTDMNAVLNAIVGGWSINSMGAFQSGYPFGVTAGLNISGVGDTISFPDRPNMLGPARIVGKMDMYFDPKSYFLQEPGHLGNAPRNSVRGPGFKNLDMGFSKRFRTTESTKLEFRADLFNILNHPNLGIPIPSIYVGGMPQFGHPGPLTPTEVAQLPNLRCNLTAVQAETISCGPAAGSINSMVGTPRQLQFAVKFIF